MSLMTEAFGTGEALDWRLRLLSGAYKRFGRSLSCRRVIRATGIPALTRRWLRRQILTAQSAYADSVSVLLGVRNRSDHRLTNALRSIRAQSLSRDAVTIVVVDFGSSIEHAVAIQRQCLSADAEYHRIDDVGVWSRSACMNQGLRLLRTKFVLFSDVDIVFSPTYLERAVELLREEPLAMVCAPMHDLPESSGRVTQEAAASGKPLDLQPLRSETTRRRGWASHPSILATWSVWPVLIGGYDEFYRHWGWEDEDLFRRLARLGVKPRVARDPHYYCHQWHPKMEGIPESERVSAVDRGRAYFERTHSILRNLDARGIGSGKNHVGQVDGGHVGKTGT